MQREREGEGSLVSCFGSGRLGARAAPNEKLTRADFLLDPQRRPHPQTPPLPHLISSNSSSSRRSTPKWPTMTSSDTPARRPTTPTRRARRRRTRPSRTRRWDTTSRPTRTTSPTRRAERTSSTEPSPRSFPLSLLAAQSKRVLILVGVVDLPAEATQVRHLTSTLSLFLSSASPLTPTLLDHWQSTRANPLFRSTTVRPFPPPLDRQRSKGLILLGRRLTSCLSHAQQGRSPTLRPCSLSVLLCATPARSTDYERLSSRQRIQGSPRCASLALSSVAHDSR